MLLGSFVVIVLLVSCTDITELIGEGFLPGESNMDLDKIELGVETYSILKDAIVTSGSSSLLLGSIDDPVFGKMKADIYAQCILGTGFDSAFHAARFFDSLVFHLSYSGHYYGDTLSEQTIRIYELTENLYYGTDTAFYSDQTAQYDPIEIASFTYKPQPNPAASLNVNTEDGDVAPQISITITTSPDHPFASRLLEINSDDYTLDTIVDGREVKEVDYESFFEFFNGFYITTDPVVSGPGALIGINQNAVSTRLQFYKHDTLLTYNAAGDAEYTRINKSASLLVSSIKGGVFNHFDHFNYDEAESEFQEQVLNGNKELGKEKVYVQSLAGSHLRVKFPDIESINELGDNIAINKAELIFKVDLDKLSFQFDAPPVLKANIQLTNDSITFLPDIRFGGEFLGGKIDTLASEMEYRFRITRYILRLVEGDFENNDGLYIFSSDENTAYERVVLFGSDPDNPYSSNRARLEITYTTIK